MGKMKRIKFEDIARIGWKFDLELHLPPFNGYQECFFDIDKFQETDEFQEFIGIIDKTGIPYEYAYNHSSGNKKIYLTIKSEDFNGFHGISN